jgi:hypothetical protein
MADPFGGFTEEALAAYQKALAERQGTDFAESDSYDFTTCIRPDGSAYGTGGKCRKGTEGEAKSGEQSKVTATPGMAARVKAAKEKLKADKAANGGKRPDRVQEERRLEQNRKQREMDRKVKANQEKQEEMLRQPAKKPEAQDATTRALEMVKANARARGLTEIKAGGSKPAAPASTTKKPAVQGYDWRKQSGTFNKAAND